jgi:protein-S-isoprenylcysteine O-methyltransferase Ste14
LVLIAYLAAAIIIDLVFTPVFKITATAYSTLLIIGIAAAVAGFSLNMAAAIGMLKAYQSGSLATTGLYRIFRDPMYVFQIFVTLPGILLLLNSWLALSAVIPSYIAYRLFVRQEHEYLLEKFGDEYRRYQNKIMIKFI